MYFSEGNSAVFNRVDAATGFFDHLAQSRGKKKSQKEPNPSEIFPKWFPKSSNSAIVQLCITAFTDVSIKEHRM